MYSGGTRAETTLAAMIASPTFNVIVLSMVFALMPFYVAVTKIVLTLALILVAIPVICRFLPVKQLQVVQDEVGACIINPMAVGANHTEGVLRAVPGFLGDYLRDLWFITRMTVPLMILAGFLGSALATLVPFEQLANTPVNIITLLIAAVIGVLAPVPMTFDIVLCAVLLNAGVPIELVMVLLFTLGSYSIYSHIVVSRTISQRAACYLAGTIVVIGILSGLGVGAYDNWQTKRALELLQGAIHIFNPVSSARAETPAQPLTLESGAAGIALTRTEFGARSPGAEKQFSREEAWHRGVDRPNGFGMASMIKPFYSAPGSVSAADMDNDGDMDVLVSSTYIDESIMLFLNDGTGRFQQTPLGVTAFAGKSVLNAMPFDVNNDGWTDIFVSTYLGGNHVLLSDKGTFSDASTTQVANHDGALYTLVTGFGDLDRDGFLDVALGNGEGSRPGRSGTAKAANRIVFNDQGSLTGKRFLDPDGAPGDSLSVLFSDFNMDGLLDYAEANDFEVPDYFFTGDGKGGLKRILRADGIIGIAPNTTMSIRSADLDNDGKFELFLTQITGRSDDISSRLLLAPWSTLCDGIERPDDKAACEKNLSIRSWYKAGAGADDMSVVSNCLAMPPQEKETCKAMILRDIAVRLKRPDLCDEISKEQIRAVTNCRVTMELGEVDPDTSYPDAIRQVMGRNVLLTPGKDGHFTEVTKAAGLEVGGWSWDVKHYAFDNKELQDVFIVNGEWAVFQKVLQSKTFYTNSGGLKFVDKTREAGLDDFAIIPSAAAADYDNDGDIDMIAASINGPLISYWNNSQGNNSMIVELRDDKGNSFGIGSKISISYGGEAKHRQLRELQLSGGYIAFDAPYVHFGLGEFKEVDSINVEWSTGETTTLKGPFQANGKLRIERNSKMIN